LTGGTIPPKLRVMRVGITGGTGFLGRPLVARLLARGDDVTVFSRTPERARRTFPPAVLTARWTPDGTPISPGVVSGLDAVVSLAGESVAGIWTAAKKERVRESRLRGTRSIVEGILGASPRPRVFLSGSASGYYGDGGDAVLTEDAPPGRGFLADLCREWEAEGRRADSPSTRVVTLRTSLPLHPEGGLLGGLLLPFRLGLGVRLGGGRQWMPWIHRDDWLSLVLHALDHDHVRGPLNLTAPSPVTNDAFTRELARALGRPAFLRVPAALLRAALGSMADETALVSQRMIPAAALATGFTFRFPELGPALAGLLSPSSGKRGHG
jgi:uncharacterized protein (TIGR01777 family)